MASGTYDVVVVGAGTAGSNVAYQFARRGRSVLLVERRPADAGGAQWVNGVLDRHFSEAGLAPPSGPERVAAHLTTHLRARDPLVGPTLRAAPTVAADMGLLGRRLRSLATDAGADVVDCVASVRVDADPRSARIRSLTIEREGGSATTIAAQLVVDASGRTGVVRRQVPDLAAWCPTLGRDELCSASDAHHHVADPAGATRFLERHGAVPGDSVTVVGSHGGFSTCAIAVSPDLAEVGVLVGCLANGLYGTAPKMIAELREREPWIGDAVSTGTGVIPLRRPYARLTAAGVALVGDAACQVFPAHGSGIGVGLVAGSMLAEGTEGLDDLGDAGELWARYQAPFQWKLGGDLAGYDVLRRATTRLGSEGVDRLVRSGLVDADTTRAGLDQRWATPPPAEAVRSARRLAANPRLAVVMAPALARAERVRRHAAHHPERLDLTALDHWERRTRQLLGRLPS